MAPSTASREQSPCLRLPSATDLYPHTVALQSRAGYKRIPGLQELVVRG